ncbi:hypothetical protein PUN28_014829 [Cardiocondyla obscurior]|uniref:Secreted protein n=1 Tax=Cardiocondyla obscurior TaxID=286306 RepID=A0AAW2EVL8_9HYME
MGELYSTRPFVCSLRQRFFSLFFFFLFPSDAAVRKRTFSSKYPIRQRPSPFCLRNSAVHVNRGRRDFFSRDTKIFLRCECRATSCILSRTNRILQCKTFSGRMLSHFVINLMKRDLVLEVTRFIQFEIFVITTNLYKCTDKEIIIILSLIKF